MANKREKTSKNEVSGRPVGTGGGSEAGSGEGVPGSRQRDRYDAKGNKLISRGTLFRVPLYIEYRRIAFYRGLKTYDLINEAMEAYLPELKKSYTQRLKDAGQQELSVA